jgi:hypothetical protein
MLKYLLFFVFLLGGCSFEPKPLQDINFSHLEVYHLNAAHVHMIDNTQEANSDNLDLLLLPQYALTTWANDRLKAVGKDKSQFRITIEKAGITTKLLPQKKTGMMASFYDEQVEYKINLVVKFEYFNQDPIFPQYEMKIGLYRTKSIEQGKTLYEKKLLCYELVTEAMKAFNEEFDNNVHEYFGSILKL